MLRQRWSRLGFALVLAIGIVVAATTSNATSTVNVNANDFNTFGHTIAASGTIQFVSCLSPALTTRPPLAAATGSDIPRA